MGPGPDDIVDHMAEIPQFRTPFSHLPEPDGIERRQLGQQKRRHLLETEQQGQRPLLHRLGCGRRIVEILQHMGVAVYLFQPHRELLIEKEAGHQCLFLAQPAGVRRDLFPHRQQGGEILFPCRRIGIDVLHPPFILFRDVLPVSLRRLHVYRFLSWDHSRDKPLFASNFPGTPPDREGRAPDRPACGRPAMPLTPYRFPGPRTAAHDTPERPSTARHDSLGGPFPSSPADDTGSDIRADGRIHNPPPHAFFPRRAPGARSIPDAARAAAPGAEGAANPRAKAASIPSPFSGSMAPERANQTSCVRIKWVDRPFGRR